MKPVAHKTKAQQVFEELRDAIVSGVLAPGAPLIIQRIAAELGVSEIPVREAVKRLEALGLAEVTPYTGAVVTPADEEELRDTLEVRAGLEGWAARLALPAIGAEDLEEMAGLVAAMDECVATGDMQRYSALNRSFHLCLYRRCPNRKLLDLCTGLMSASDRARAVFQRRPGFAPRSNQEHRAMLRAVREADPQRLESLVRDHQCRVAVEFAAHVAAEGGGVG